MKAYPKYKESGISWLGAMPEHWSIGKIKFLCNAIFAGATPSTSRPEYWENGSIPWIPSGCCHDCDINNAPKFITEAGLQNSSTKLIPANTTVMALTGATCAQLGYLTFESCANQSVVAFVENKEKANSRYLYYALLAAREEILSHKSGGAQGGINQEDCSNTIIPFISLAEQEAIAAYLDDKSAKIDECVRLLDLQQKDLQKFRSVVISKIFSKEGVRMLPFKYFLKDEDNNLRVGPFGSALSGSDYKEEGIWVYNQRCVLDNNFKTNNTFVDEEKYEELKGFEVYPDDVLITTRGTIGKIAIVPNDAPKGILHPCLIRCKIDFDKIHPHILVHLFNDCDFVINQLKMKSNATTIDVVYSYSLKNIMLPLLTREEQQSLVGYFDSKIGKIDEAIRRIDEQIKDLRAYRTALISEVVTGKIDVRNN